jgi:peptidyl-prolyl cis-trans isomerase A (cyclophilin A)
MLAQILLLVAVAAVPLRSEVAIVITTDLGVIEATLDETRAPATVRNFLRYVDAGHYSGGRFHRTVRTRPDNQPQSPIKIDVIQAAVAPQFNKQSFPPVPLERTSKTGLQHSDGALSMARSGVDDATSDFFICVGPQPELDFGGRRNPDGQGFAVFGRVTAGSEVVRRIQESPAGDQRLTPPIRILSIRRR